MKSSNASKYISAAVYVFFGLMLIIFPSLVGKTLCYMLGGAAIAVGIVYIVSYIMVGVETRIEKGDNGLANGIVLMIIGLFVMLKPELLISLIPFAMGLMIIINGVHGIQNAVDMKKLGYGSLKGNMIMSAIVIVFGLVMMFNPFSTARILFVLMGIGLVASAIIDLVADFIIRREVKKAEKAKQAQ